MSSATAPAKVSFTVRRPTPVSRTTSSGANSDAEANFKIPALPRHLNDASRSTAGSPLANGSDTSRTRKVYRDSDDSSDDEEEDVDEIVTGFDEFGVQRSVILAVPGRSDSQLTAARIFVNDPLHSLKPKEPEGPLIIPALQNRDWRDARKRKAIFIPGSAQATTGADGSVGGLGTRDSINSGPQVAGLVRAEKRLKTQGDEEGMVKVEEEAGLEREEAEETEDEKARRAILAGVREGEADEGSTIDVIPVVGGNDWSGPETETDAYRRDVLTRPNSATLDDYDRVPVSEFGAALLRGMGWKPGQAASRKRTGPVEPYLPAARPALLGIGAKERVIEDIVSANGKKVGNGSKRPERKYIPLIKREKSPSRMEERTRSRRASLSPEPRKRDGQRDRDRDYDSRRKHDYYSDRDREHKDRRREKEYDGERDRRRDREPERSRDRQYGKDKDRETERVRDRNGRH